MYPSQYEERHSGPAPSLRPGNICAGTRARATSLHRVDSPSYCGVPDCTNSLRHARGRVLSGISIEQAEINASHHSPCSLLRSRVRFRTPFGPDGYLRLPSPVCTMQLLSDFQMYPSNWVRPDIGRHKLQASNSQDRRKPYFFTFQDGHVPRYRVKGDGRATNSLLAVEPNKPWLPASKCFRQSLNSHDGGIGLLRQWPLNVLDPAVSTIGRWDGLNREDPHELFIIQLIMRSWCL